MDPLGSSPEMDISISNCGGKIVCDFCQVFIHAYKDHSVPSAISLL